MDTPEFKIDPNPPRFEATQNGYFRRVFEAEAEAARKKARDDYLQRVVDQRAAMDARVRAAVREECATPPPYNPETLQQCLGRVKRCAVPHHASPDAMRSDYLTRVMNPVGLQKTVRRLVSVIKKSGVEFEAIAFRGVSGSMVAPLVACKMKKGFLAVRKHKRDEYCHSSQGVEGAVRIDCRYIVIDDLISSGATIWHIVNDVSNYTYEDVDGTTGSLVTVRRKRDCVGVFLYNSWTDNGKTQCIKAKEIHAPYDVDKSGERNLRLDVWEFQA